MDVNVAQQRPALRPGNQVAMKARLFEAVRTGDGWTMARLVMKFGGTSVADVPHIRNMARHVKREVDAGHQVAVVVSAMAGTTDQLVAWTRQAAALHDAREDDTVVSAGEPV